MSKAKQAAITRNKALPKWQAAPVSWPSAASTVVDLAPQSGGGRMGRATIGGLPITVASVDETAQLPAGRSVAPADTPGQVRVEVLDHARSAKADVPLALRLTRPDGRTTGKVRVTVDYSSFRDAFGADYANRLGIAVLADCAATTPQNLGCRDRKPVPSAVDTKGMTVSAEVDLSAVASTVDAPPLSAPAPVDQTRQNSVTTAVVPQQGAIAKAVPPSEPTNNGGEPVERNVRSAQNVGGVVMAVTAGAGSDIGDFSRTTLSQSASWQAGGPSAAFTWSYPITVPPVEGGLVPAVALGYSSAAVDGQTANNNTQPSWIGEGFSYEPGYIERSYTACKDDTSPVAPYWSQTATMSDLCWRVPNASLVWNGHATELIPDDASSSPNTATPTVWHLADDDGTKVEYLWDQGTARTGYWHDEHWKLTTKDGTQYFFGLSAVPGRSAYTQTLSVLGEGIMGNHAGEPCFSSSAWNLSWCRIAYRWNLDYVVDPHGNAMAYFYNREANNQMIYGGSSTLVGYYRYATLDRIEYGMRAGSGDYPAARILFTSADRCWSGASTCAANHDAARWPDVPWDLDCQASPCGTPSYWTTKRLVKIETQVYRDALGHMPPTGFGWDTIDSYNLASTAPDTMHSGSTPVLVLNSLTHDGTDAGIGDAVRTVISSPLPSVVFNYAVMQNRAVLHTGDTESWKYRIASILNETGGATNVAYNALDPGCTGQTAPVFETNSSRCFPQMFRPNGPGGTSTRSARSPRRTWSPAAYR